MKTMNLRGFNRNFGFKISNLRRNFWNFWQKFGFENLNLRRNFGENLNFVNFGRKFVNFRQIFVSLAGLFAPIFAAFALNACSIMPEPQANPTTYILKANDKIVLKRGAPHKKSIQIASIQSTLYLKTNEIAYIKDNELSSYSKHSWKSSPANSLSTLLAAKFEKNKLFEVVLNANSQLKADLVLESRFDSFEQVFESSENSENSANSGSNSASNSSKKGEKNDENSQKSYIHLELSANLVENSSKKLLGYKHFSYKIPVQKLTPSSAVASFDEALNQLGDDITLWIDGVLR